MRSVQSPGLIVCTFPAIQNAADLWRNRRASVYYGLKSTGLRNPVSL